MSSVNLQSLNELRSTLIRRGIPPRYAHRVTAELNDHAHDLATNGDNSGNGLGDLSHLADEITTTFRRRTFAGRHPWLMFVPLPFPLAIFACIGTLFAYFGSIMLLAKWFIDPSQIMEGTFASTFRIAALVLPAASCAGVAWFVCRCARRAGYRWKNALLACLPVFLFACHVTSEYQIASMGESKGKYMFGFFLPFLELQNNRVTYGWQQLLQVLVPLFVIGWMMAREARRQPPTLVSDTA